MSPLDQEMNSPPPSQGSVSEGSEYSDVYDLLIRDLEQYMEMFMPDEVARRMSYYLVAKGHTGLVQFLRGLSSPVSPNIVPGSEASLNAESQGIDIGK